MKQVGYVLDQNIANVWPKISHWVVEISGGRATSAETLDQLFKGLTTLWLAFDDETLEPKGFATTRITVYPNLRALTIVMLGGIEFSEWEELMHDAMVLFAKANECTVLELYGRPGWSRQLKRFGWETKFITAQLKLEDT